MVTGPIPLCYTCKRYRGIPTLLHTCDAYPDGIPAAILSWQHDHHTIYAGDNGLVYEPGTPTKKAAVASNV